MVRGEKEWFRRGDCEEEGYCCDKVRVMATILSEKASLGRGMLRLARKCVEEGYFVDVDVSVEVKRWCPLACVES